MDKNTAVGPDDISGYMLRETSTQIAPFLANFFNLCFDLGYFPPMWKISNVVPIFKSGDRSDVSNYRPISLQSLISKIMERVVFNQLLFFLSNTDQLPHNQFGFLPTLHGGCSDFCS